jgi:hypothetical protein
MRQQQGSRQHAGAILRQEAQTGKAFSRWLTVPHVMGLILAVAYILRNSILVSVIPGFGSTMGSVSYLMLGVCLVYLLAAQCEINFFAMLLVLACLPGSWDSAMPDLSLPKYGGWALVVLSIGPTLLGKHARQLRNGAWTTTMILLSAIGVGSFFWWVLRLPLMGIGKFTGVMLYANTLGPLAGLGSIFALSKLIAPAKTNTKRAWGLVALACLISCICAASRISVIALVLALTVFAMLERNRIKWSLLMLFVPIVVSGGYLMTSKSESIMALTATLAEKGLENTREHLWRARLREFHAHPLLGVGIGVVEAKELGEGMTIEDGKVSVEPGSSYLGLLSMTGLAGATALVILLISVGLKWVRCSRHLADGQASQLMVIGAFMAVNAVAEGWIIAVGSPLCFVFWLWLGHVIDSVDAAELQVAKKVRQRRIARVSEAGVSEGRRPEFRKDGGQSFGRTEAGVSEAGVSEAGVSEAGVSEAGVSEARVSEAGVAATMTHARLLSGRNSGLRNSETPISGGLS